MAARIIDGKAISQRRRAELTERVRELVSGGLQPFLVAVGVGEDPGWRVYQRNQEKACRAIGIGYRHDVLPNGTSQAEVMQHIVGLNANPQVHGILLQSPLPDALNTFAIQSLISPQKDVEGVNPANLGMVVAERPGLSPCTALAAMALIHEALPDLTGVESVVVGSSVIVGKPIGQMLLAAGATVTNCHIYTREVAAHTSGADLVVVAVGKPGVLTAEMVKPGATVVDVGINRIAGPDGKRRVVGDAAPEVAERAGAITPVPGGVGAVTTTVLMESTVAAAESLQASEGAITGPALANLFQRLNIEIKPADSKRIAALFSRHLVATPDLTEIVPAFEHRLGQRLIVFDGGMTSSLIDLGVEPGRTAEANLESPDLVLDTHRRFLAAGADAITANTFYVNRYRCGDREGAIRLAQAGMRLAREAGGGRSFAFASIGPLGAIVGVDIPIPEAESAAAEIGLAMADVGADGFLVEGMRSNEEAECMVRGLRRVSDLPILASRELFRVDEQEIGDFARRLAAAGVTAIGFNCGHGPRRMREPLRVLAGLTDLPIFALPNAGYPSYETGRPVYNLQPAYLAEQTERYVELGAAIVGGCCGVAPEHIRALAERFAGEPVALRGQAAVTPASASPHERPLPPLLRDLREARYPIMVSLPGHGPAGGIRETARRLADAGADAVGLYGTRSGGTGRFTCARLRDLQDRAGKPAILELPAGAIGLRRAEEALMDADLLGLELVLIDDGVFSGLVPQFDDRDMADVDELLGLVDRLNRGLSLGGSRLDEATALRVGVRLQAEQIGRAEDLLEAGADWIDLAPVYQPATFRHIMASYACALPLVIDIMVLEDVETARELDNEVPAIHVPLHLQERLARDPEADLRGVLDFLRHWRGRLAGVNLVLPDARSTAALRILGALGAGEGRRDG